MIFPSGTSGNTRRGSSGSAHYLHEVTKRSRSARRRRRRRLWRWAFRILLLAVLGVTSFFGFETALEKFFFNNPAYDLTHIDAELDGVLSEREVEHLAGVRKGQNIFLVDLAKVDHRLRQIPMVESVEVARQLPDTLIIRVHARQPVAWVAENTLPVPPSLLIDADGVIMRPRLVRKEFYGLPMIYGVDRKRLEDGDLLHERDLRAALDLLARIRARSDSLLRIRSVDISRGYAIEMINDQNARILIRTTDLSTQLARLERLLEHCAETNRVLCEVNLMVERNIPVKFAMSTSETITGEGN